MTTMITPNTQTVRYAIVGVGGRAVMFLNPLCQEFRKGNQLVAMCDTNPGRIAYYQRSLQEQFDYPLVPGFIAGDFDQMIAQTQPDVVIVTTVDAFHHEYAIRAMELGCDVIVEKPMTIDESKCQAIFDAVARTGRKLRVTFNCRWATGPVTLRNLLAEGTIGEVLHVDMEYMLGVRHGAGYFRRWHREKEKSGGLMVHKSTHHFDLVNWWLDAVPEEVFGYGRLAFYGSENARKRGIEVKYDRYVNQDIHGDPFALDFMRYPLATTLFLDNEHYDGYCPDRNVFNDNITAEDTMSVLVRYRTGATLNYSLNAYLPREGMRVAFNGERGRLEYEEIHAQTIGADEHGRPVEDCNWHYSCKVYPIFGKPYEIQVPRPEGGHGGGDPLLQEQMFSHCPAIDALGRNAGHEQGAASILIGVAANHAFVERRPIRITDLCPELGHRTRLHELV